MERTVPSVKKVRKIRKKGLYGLCVVLMMGCAAQRSAATNIELDQAMAERAVEMKAQFAHPLVTRAMSQIGNSGLLPQGSTIGQINIAETTNFFRIHGDSVTADLPYYGERQMGGGYANKDGIEFAGVPENLEIRQDSITKGYTITFGIDGKTENFRVNAQVQPNLRSQLRINSTHRTAIRYSGTLVTSKEER